MTKPADVFVRVELLRSELEILRQELGRRSDDRGELKVTKASPREVLFEALALFRKADRFCFERTADAPAFLLPEQQKKMKHRLKRGQERFWRLDLWQVWGQRC